MNKKVPGLKKKAPTSTNLYNHPTELSPADSLLPFTDPKTRFQRDSELLNILKLGRNPPKKKTGKNTPSLSHHTADPMESSEYISNTDLTLTEKLPNPAEDIYAHMKNSAGKKKFNGKGVGG
jgi:hypothetical protein